jgi:exonuclease III
MLVLSLNIRGIGGTLKAASFRRLLEKSKPDIIFLQETLTDAQRSRDFVFRFRPDWYSVAVSSISSSGGLLVAWDPNSFDLRPSLTAGGILCIGSCLATSRDIAFLNIYGPCSNRKHFWSHLADSGILSIPYLIAGGDLNLIFSAEENWGGSFVPGATEDFFRNIFASNKLTDILPAQLAPTWRNGRSGIDAISRRLDRFFVAEEYLSSSDLPASWVDHPFFSDHAPIYLQLRSPDRHFSLPVQV